LSRLKKEVDPDPLPFSPEVQELESLVPVLSEAELEIILLRRTTIRLSKELLIEKGKKSDCKKSSNKTSVDKVFKEEIKELLETYMNVN
jgi:hypothetical protein